MKKKFFIGIAMSLFAVATVFNMNISEQNNSNDVSLDAIAVMAQAQSEMVPGWTNDWDSPHNICNIPGGRCDVSAQRP
jgi:hypothetical protein